MNNSLADALWRTRTYLLPELKHFILCGFLSVLVMLLELATVLLAFDLLTNKVFLAEPLSDFQASLMGLDAQSFVGVETLAQESRYTLRNFFLVMIVGILVLRYLLGSGIEYYITWILQRVNQHLRLAMMGNAVHLSLRFHDDSQVGDAIYRVYQDSAMVTSVVQNALIQPAIVLGNLVIAFGVISLFQPYLGLLFLVALVPSVLAARFFTPVLRNRSERSRLANSELTSYIQESMNGVRLLKASGVEDVAFEKFDLRSHRALDRAFEVRASVAILKLVVFMLTAFVVVGADYFMTHWVWDGSPTFGFALVAIVGFAVWNLGAFQAARERFVSLSDRSEQLAQLWSILQDMHIGLERSFYLLNVQPEVTDKPDAVSAPERIHSVVFDQVGFSYQPNRPILQDLSFSALQGAMTAIVGSTGAGKSTLMNLLLRLYNVQRGRICLDGTDISDIRVKELREAISIVLQENALFPTSIADNIRYAVPRASDETVRAAAHISCADEFIRDLPHGYDTELGERGGKLSTGQRQRISIARAIVKNAPILILDEPTASLDVATEHRVLQRMSEWGKDKVIFFITHRIATIRQADQIIFLENGSVAEQGSHEELMRITEGRYRQFVEAETRAAS